MSTTTPRRFGVIDNTGNEPIPFELCDDHGNVIGTFHATKKPRLDIAQAMARAVSLKDGIRVYDVDILTYCVREFLIKEIYRELGAGSNGEPVKGWVAADDLERFDRIVRSDRVAVPIETLGDIVMWLLEETTGHPTGGSGRLSAGPTNTASTSKDDSAS